MIATPASEPGGGEQPPVDACWALPVEAVARELRVDLERGLTEAEAAARLERHGLNTISEARRVGAWLILVRQLKSVVVALLAAAGVVSLAFGHWLEGAAVLIVVLINTAIGFVTELRAVRSMESLRRLGQTRARVRREGHQREIVADQLVPGDVVPLEAGDVVSADLRIVESSLLEVDESTFTGESVPVAKQVEPVDAEATIAERHSMLFRGTSLTRGAAIAVVVATGMQTELGHIARLAEDSGPSETPLERHLARLGRRLVWVAVAIAAVTTVVGVVRGQSPLMMVQTGIALAVAAIPEGLPIVATLALARGLWRMARRNALINRLSAVETLGATSVILTDKTGTLTENRMTVTRLATPEREYRLTGTGLELEGAFHLDGKTVEPTAHSLLLEALEIGALCNNAGLNLDGSGMSVAVGDPLEVALLVAARKAGLRRSLLLEREPYESEVAFDAATRAMATYQRSGAGFRVAVKGAPESIVAAATAARGPDGDERPLDETGRRRWLELSERMAAEGLRVLALGGKRVDSPDVPPYERLTLVALVGLLDPPRSDVRPALQHCRDAGVRVVVATGDQAGTAIAVSRALDIGQDDRPAVTGATFPAAGSLSPADRERLLGTAVFARVDPEQKMRLIELHQEAGAVVAMTGDGVNDAPALRHADIGVAMGQRGTQVAREAADMVLQDDSFRSIVVAVRQGRVIFDNIRRFVVYLLSCNLSEIFIVFGASVVGGPLPVLPLQILYLNLVTDVFPALALGFGDGDRHVMRRPPRDAREPILTRRGWLVIAGHSAVISVAVLGALAAALIWLELPERQAVTVSFLTLATAQVVHVFNMRSVQSRVLSNDVVRNPWVWGAILLCFGLLVAAVKLPILARVLGTQDPGWNGILIVAVASVVPLIVGQISLTIARWRRG